MISLYIDTRDNKHVVSKLNVNGNIFEIASDSVNKRPESILNLIDALCKKAHVSIHQIDDIQVEEGPGSYTGLKVGVSVANALSFALGKEVNSVKEPILPKYE